MMLRPSQTLSDFSRDVQAQALPNRMAATLPGAKSWTFKTLHDVKSEALLHILSDTLALAEVKSHLRQTTAEVKRHLATKWVI